MGRDLAALQRAHAALLTSLPEASAPEAAAVPADVRSHFDGLRHAQRGWEDRMTALLDTVSTLQSPGAGGVPSTAGGAPAR